MNDHPNQNESDRLSAIQQQIAALTTRMASLETSVRRALRMAKGQIAVLPAGTSMIASEFLTARASLTELSSTLLSMQPLLAQDDLEELLRKFKAYWTDPKQLATGLTSTGDRKEFEKRWRQSCRTSPDQQPPAPKKGSLEWYVWDHTIDGEITTHVVLTWEYDDCYIYNADFTFTVQRNDEPEDYGVIMWESFSEPAGGADEQYQCHPCTPKCLRAQATVVFYVLSATTGLPKGISHKINIDVLICPSGATDNTDFKQNQGDGSGPKSPQKPPVDPNPTNGGNWGVSKIMHNPDGTWDYSPK